MDDEPETIIQEATKVAIKEAGEKIASFLNKLLGETVIELGGIPHDWAIYYRYRNLLSIQDKIEAIHKKRKTGGKTLPIPPRYAIPLIQNASQENEESLQEMWAELISNFIDPEKHFNPKKIYIEILSSLEPLDAKVLHFFSRQRWKLLPGVPGGGITLSILSGNIGATEEEIRLSLENLARLGCIIDEHVVTYNTPGSSSFGRRVIDPAATFRPSPLGIALMKACGVEEPDDD